MDNEVTFISEAGLQDFEQKVLQQSAAQPVLVDFWADWCAPCKTLMPILANLAEAYQGKFLLVKVNSDLEQELAVKYGVRSLPTVKVFRHGEVIDEFMGALPESQVRAFIEKHVEHESDRATDEAERLFAQGSSSEAIALLGETIKAGAANDRPALKLAEILLHEGQVEPAREAMKGLSIETQVSPEFKRLEARLKFAAGARDASDLAQLRQRVDADPADLEARVKLGAALVASEAYEEAMAQYLEVARRDRGYAEDIGRTALLDIFALLGDGDERVKKYRRLLANALN